MTPEALIIESMFRIADKEGGDVDFTLNGMQRELDTNLTGRDLIPKGRQFGVSSYFLARYTVACLMKRNVRAVVISHDVESTQRMFNKVKYFIDNIKGPKPDIDHSSKNEITFPKMNSMFYLGTAGSRKFGRGDTITHLHCSEYAYWPNSADLLAGLMQAVPMSGEIALESTGNGAGNDYHRRCKRAAEGQSRYTIHFLDWRNFPEYVLPLTEEEEVEFMASLQEDLGETDLINILTPAQLAWRRMKLEEMDFDLKQFKQEYPITLDECFQSAGYSIFYKVKFEPTPLWKKQDNLLSVLEPHPMDGCHYVLGADVAGGVERDNSVVEIVCLETMEQVAEWCYNKVAPDAFAQKIADLGTLFNKAYVIPESNNHGLVTIDNLMDIYDPMLIYDKEQTQTIKEQAQLMTLGFRTTSKTKPLMIGKLRQLLAHELTIHSTLLSDELSTFVETESGALEAQSGCFDDRVMAMANLVMGIEEAAIYTAPVPHLEWRKAEYKNPLLLENIIEELRGRGGGFPISKQVGGDSAWKR